MVARVLRAMLALAFVLTGALALAAAGDLQPIPPLQARVTDLTGTLDAAQKQALEQQLAALEKTRGAQIAVLMVPTTAPEDIAQYAIRVFDAWQLGRRGIDDGALLVVAKDDRRVRIEVARGLEGAIPDAAAMRIIREYITPRFRAGDYYGGIHDAVGALVKLVDGEALPPPLAEDRDTGRGGDRLFLGAMAAWIAALFLRGLFNRMPALLRAGLVGAGTGGVGWLISGLLGLGLGAGLIGFFIGLASGGGGGGFANRGGWGGFGGGWGSGGDWGGFGSSGGSHGGGFRGGGLGGGGFSGGGGISAGGGASGSW